MDQVTTDANIGGDDNIASDSSTDIENLDNTTDDVDSDVDNQDGNLPDQDKNGEQPKGKVPYNRFKSIVDEKNDALRQLEEIQRELAEIKKANEFRQSDQKQQEEKPKQQTGSFDFRQFDNLFSDTKYNFKPADQYESIEELFNDMKGAMLNEIFNANESLAKERQDREMQSRQRIDAEIEAVTKYFGKDLESRDAFFDIVEKVAKKTNSVPDFQSLLSVYEEMKQSGASDKEVEDQMSEDEEERKQTNKKINTKPNKSGKTSSPQGFNPNMHRNMSMDDLANSFFKNR